MRRTTGGRRRVDVSKRLGKKRASTPPKPAGMREVGKRLVEKGEEIGKRRENETRADHQGDRSED